MSTNLFIRPDGKSMIFWRSFVSMHQNLKILVETRGGLVVDQVSSDYSENVIRLLEGTVKPVRRQYEYFCSSYILDCVEEDRILPNLREYKIVSWFPSSYGEYDPLDVLLGKIGWSQVSTAGEAASSLRVNKRSSVSKKRLIPVPDVSDKEVVSKEILEAGEEDKEVIRTDFTSVCTSRPMGESNTMSSVIGMKDKDDRMTDSGPHSQSGHETSSVDPENWNLIIKSVETVTTEDGFSITVEWDVNIDDVISNISNTYSVSNICNKHSEGNESNEYVVENVSNIHAETESNESNDSGVSNGSNTNAESNIKAQKENTNDTNAKELDFFSNTKNLFREPYSEKEEAAITEFLLTAGGYNMIRGQRIWKEMEAASICPGRSAQALREHFLKHTMLKQGFKVTEEQLRDADRNSKHMKILSSRSYVSGEYHGLRGFRPGAKYYTEEEDRVIMEFIVNNGHEEVVGGNQIWKLMMERNLLEGRTWQSMKERFCKNILNRLDFFDLTSEQKMKLEKRKRKRRK